MDSFKRVILIFTVALSVALVNLALILTFIVVESLNKEAPQETMYKTAFDAACLEFRKNESSFDCNKRVKLVKIFRSDPKVFDRIFYSHTFADSKDSSDNPPGFDVPVYLDGSVSKPKRVNAY